MTTTMDDNQLRTELNKAANSESREEDFERVPSLTTLRHELSDVHPMSFRSPDDKWDPNQSKAKLLQNNADQRSKYILARGEQPPPPPPNKGKGNTPNNSAEEMDVSITTLRSELSDVHPKSFRTSEHHWDPNQSKVKVLQASEDHRERTLPTRSHNAKGSLSEDDEEE